MDWDFGGVQTTYIDNGDGTCRVEVYNKARWYSGYEIIHGPGRGAFVPARWRRVARWWFDVRCWIAERILRVPVGEDL